ncbi:MAG: methylmalonyl-CoA mutase subunit beta [Roseibium sp.]|nr:methylmalonyl-CoA mutase subunit beta [Roseibium sp.]
MTETPTLSVPEAFLSADEATWLAAVDAALKGGDRARLTTQTEDGLKVEPLYGRREDVVAQAGRGASQPWTVIQRIDHPDVSAANAQILDDLAGGAGGLELLYTSSSISGEQGVRIDDLAGMERLLDGVILDLVTLRLEAGHESGSQLALMMAYLDKKGIDPDSVDLHAGIDYLSWLCVTGRFRLSLAEVEARVQDVACGVVASSAAVRVFEPNGSIWHDFGAGQVEELACVMASALAFLRCMEKTPVPLDQWPERFGFTLAAEADQIGTIAKARAARRLWAEIQDACGLTPTPMKLHMQTSFRMLTMNDPWVNLLRNTVAVFGAGVGGADSVTVLPHTQAIGVPDSFARRLARNTQSILMEESNLHKVADPSAGSGAVEARTEDMAAAAWDMFQDIERAGGMFAALESGAVQDRIAATAQARSRDVARRKRAVTGVSEFPDLNEKPVAVLASAGSDLDEIVDQRSVPEPSDGARFSAMRHELLNGARIAGFIRYGNSSQVPAVQIRPLTRGRVAEPFEHLRQTADRATKALGARPTVFLACLGPVSEFTARATWTKNAFAAGGLASTGGEPVASEAELGEAFRASGATVACLVSSDRIYAEQAEPAARLLKRAGVSHLYLAGKPGDDEAKWRAAGVDTFVHAGADLLELLARTHEYTGIDAAGRQEPATSEASS